MDDTGGWSEVYLYRINGSATVRTDNYSGQYYRNGSNVSLAEGNSTDYSGTFDGRSLLLNSSGFTFVFTR